MTASQYIGTPSLCPALPAAARSAGLIDSRADVRRTATNPTRLSDMPRRTFISGISLGLLAGPLAAEAQQAAKVARIGYLSPNLAADPIVQEAFGQGLRDLGYVEGRNLVIEYRDAGGKPERLP